MRRRKVPRNPRGTFTVLEWGAILGCVIFVAAITAVLLFARGIG